MPIGYYVTFKYKENDINCDVMINSLPLNEDEGDIISQNIYTYKKYVIYMRDFLDEERNLIARESVAIIGNYVCIVNVGHVSPNDVNFERYQEISLEFMCELIDDYIANNN